MKSPDEHIAVPAEAKPLSDLPMNSRLPYAQEEIDLILSVVPTAENARRLSAVLRRKPSAVQAIMQMAYSGKWLKQQLERSSGVTDSVAIQVGHAKKRMGIVVGHVPR